MPSPADRLDSIRDVEHLEDLLSEPTPAVIEALARLDGDVLVLGVGGKMGPTLARMARRAFDEAGSRRRVIGVARFSDPSLAERLKGFGVETIAADLLDPAQVDRLPDAPNVVFMAGMKFGSTGQEPMTWAVNCLTPALAARRYRDSRVVAFSTGNVYGLTRPEQGGSKEEDAPDPRGEYAMSCLGRERIFQHFSLTQGTPTVLFRLNYAVEMRYGVLADLARKVYEGRPVGLAMGRLNAVWQGDANATALQSLELAASPARIVNATGPEILEVRHLAEVFGRLMDKPVTFEGAEAPDALLNDASRTIAQLGKPRIDIDRLMRWTADWIARGGQSLGKPTKFEVRDGRF
ncbi:NAD-dependent epimerase/dehydratase family protein [Paludisphaera rhizosphaerae]|uniref:NAD-dependent epimerase/dehydratase family protein n=1 Tax=Paludisphaera rhizosphaerae TaxID=2711216 RepID=UPI0013ECF03D|nr:NAD(P)-dependent oxidoreductase [Paludisphaera rhizosphaerae]